MDLDTILAIMSLSLAAVSWVGLKIAERRGW
jgi:hypothetical protein